MLLPWDVEGKDHDGIREAPTTHLLHRSNRLGENSLRIL
jgi:hypothetical protein